ncbi:MAG TPA: glycosyltransferase family 4 protein, partial [Phycisphaerae bacterium]|nr:glycosyltransferase family 4 protein [Phycisphaerae bacterium]
VLVHANLLVALTRPLVTHPFYWIQSIHTVQEKPAWHWWAQGLIGNLPDATVAPSRAILQKLQAYGPVPRPIVIPNGILISKFRDALPMSPVPWPAGAKVIGYVGRFDPVKRIPLLIEAMNHLPDDFHLALVGYGNEEGRLRKLAASVRNGSGRIHFVGGTASPERWYKTFDLFCLVSDAEGFALAALEAAASGVQVLVCSTPALRETLPNVAWMPRDASARQVATALLTCVNTPETRAKPALDERFGVGMMVGRYGELIGNLLPGGRKHTNRM